MSFLDNIKKKNEGAGTAPTPAAKTNPLAAKPAAAPNPLVKKTEIKVEAPAETAKKPLPLLAKKDGTATGTPAAKPNPFGPKKVAPATAKAEENASAEEPKSDIVADMKAADTDQAAQKDAAEAVKEAAVETPAKAEAEAKTTTAPAPANKKKPAAAKAKTTTDKPEVKAEAKASDAVMDIPTTAISYAEAVESITSSFVDPEWEAYKEEVQNDLNEIVIEDDMNPATLKSAVSKLTKVRNKVWNNYQGTKTLYENLSTKEPEGLIERIKKVNLGDASNDMQRKKAGVEACMNYIDKSGNLVNLYELLDETRGRYNFLRGIMDSIEYKRSVLVTMNGALKIESNLGPAE